MHNYFMKTQITIRNVDFIQAVANAKSGDFVYFDPPYDALNEKTSFTAYTKFNFNKDD